MGTDATRSHVIKFTSKKTSGKYKSELATNISKIGQGIFQGGIKNLIEGKISQEVRDNATNVINDITAADIDRIPHQSIALYIPDTVNVTYGAQYDDISLTESLGKAYFLAQAGTSMIDLFKEGGDKTFEQLANQAGSDPFLRKAVADAVGSRLGMNNLGDLALRGIGQAMNPQLQVLFRGVGFRSFQLDFVFTP